LKTVALVIDYQNLHLSAHYLFAKNSPIYSSLLHPLSFANVLLVRRAILHPNLSATFSISRVDVFRGLPSNKREPRNYSRNLSQKSEWERDRRVSIYHRDLKYFPDGSAPSEKGIDVMIALKFVELSRSGIYDLVILASHDSDLEPALESKIKHERTSIETVSWAGRNRLNPQGMKIWNTVMTYDDFRESLDPRDYSKIGLKRKN
jgi:uncharacterized LabA/DUF88 family protein